MNIAPLVPLCFLLLAAMPGTGETRVAARSGDADTWRAAEGPARTDSGAVSSHRRAAAPRERRPSKDVLARGVFLVASESLSDPNFSQTVVLLLEYDKSGAMGLVINRPTEVSLASLLPEEKDLKGREELVFIGGPVSRTQLFLLVRSGSRPLQSEQIVDGVYASTSLQTLRAIIAEKSAVAAFQAYAGYAGWGPGQLDAELMRGDWLVAPADSETVFDKAADTIWPDLIRKNRGLWVYRAGAESPPLSFDSNARGDPVYH